MWADDALPCSVMLKVVLLGDSNTGKTALLERFVHDRYTVGYRATIGADFMTKHVHVQHTKANIQCWDTAGTERFQSLSNAFYRGSDACVLVFDSTIRATFDHISMWKEEFLACAGVPPEQRGRFPFVVVATKCDLKHDRAITSDDALEWCAENGPEGAPIPFFETSSLENVGVEDVFHEVARLALARGHYHEQVDRSQLGSSLSQMYADIRAREAQEKSVADAKRTSTCC